MYVPLDREAKEPLAKQIAAYLEELIRRGHLRAGAHLPATRTLARDLGVNKGTVEAAYGELESRRLVRIRPGKGASVRSRIPETTELSLPWKEPRSRDPLPAEAYVPETAHEPPRDFAGRTPRVVHARSSALRRFHETALHAAGSLFSPPPPLGEAALRSAAGRHFARSGVVRSPHEVAAFAGRRELVERVARQFVPHRGWVAVVAPPDPDVIAGLRDAGARVVVADAESAERTSRRDGLRMLVVTTGCARVPGAAIDPSVRRAIADAARARGIPILEDLTHRDQLADAGGQAFAVLDATGRVIPWCDLSDELGGAYDGAILAGSSKLLERIRGDGRGSTHDRLTQRVLAAALDDPARPRVLRALREHRKLRNPALARCVDQRLASATGHEFSATGDVLRIDLPVDVSGTALRDAAAARHVHVWSAVDCGLPRARDRFVLLDLTRHDEGDLLDGIRRLGTAFDELVAAD